MSINTTRPSMSHIKKLSTRDGFSEGIVQAAKHNPNIVALTADLTDSTRLSKFKKLFPNRFVQVGVAEQNLAGVAVGLARVGKIPFITSFAVFSPGRNWEQIRNIICYDKVNVKIIGTHSGLGVGEDGATHQALEDIAITRVIPNLQVIVPCDFYEAKKATIAISKITSPVYLRLTKQEGPIITNKRSEFKVGKSEIFREGRDVAIIACGPIIHEALLAANILEKEGISVLVLNNHTIKPLDKDSILDVAKKTKAVVTVEDHQIYGGLGGAVAEILSQNYPVPMQFIGINDSFGESGKPSELYVKYKCAAQEIINAVNQLLKRKKA